MTFAFVQQVHETLNANDAMLNLDQVYALMPALFLSDSNGIACCMFNND